MFKDQKVQLSLYLFLFFFFVCAGMAYFVPSLQTQFFSFSFMALGAMYTALCIFIKPDGKDGNVKEVVAVKEVKEDEKNI